MLRINGVKTIVAVILSLIPLGAFAQQTASIRIGLAFVTGQVRPGRSATIDVFAQNAGPAAAENVVVSFTPQPGVTLHVNGIACDESKVPVDCSLGTLERGRDRTLHLTETFPAALGSYSTQVSIRSTTPDSEPFGKQVQFAIQVSNAPDLAISLDGSFFGAKFDPGAPLGRAFIVKNKSEFDAHDLVIVFSPLLNLTMKSGTYGAFTCSASATDARCTTPLLRAGETLTFNPDLHIGTSTEGGRVAMEAVLIFSEPDFDIRDNRTATSGVAYRTFTVSNTADAGFGTLREALLQSATGCTYFETPCKIAFAITEPASEGGWYTIEPLSPLPPITGGGIVLDARTQTTFSGDTNPAGPEVELSGRRLTAGNGITLAVGQGLELRGLAINSFPGYGIYASAGGVGFQAILIDGNYIGVDPTGKKSIPNYRGIGIFGAGSTQIQNNVISGNARSGIFIDSGVRTGIVKNVINNNGASGVFAGNAAVDTTVDQNDISFNREFAVALAPQTQQSAVRRSTMRGNGNFAIDVALDLRTPNSASDNSRLPNAPVLTSTTYDPVADTTTVKGTTRNECNSCDLFVDIYASNSLAPNGAPQAERYLGTVQMGGYSNTLGNFTFSTKGNASGQLITAAVTRSQIPQGLEYTAAADPQVYGTSELSDPITVK